MATQDSALAVAVAALSLVSISALPHALLLEVLSRLPADSRLRCREVCRAWRTALNERSLWLRLDLSPASGVARAAAKKGLLRAAAARAGGQLETLDVSGCHTITSDALLEVVRANSASLRQLHSRGDTSLLCSAAALATLLRAAPGLRACRARVYTYERAEARAMLRNEPPFGALRLERLSVLGNQFTADDAILALAADLAACNFIRELVFESAALAALDALGAPAPAPAALDALLDAALACRLHTLRLSSCHLSAASAPALTRLLGGGALAELAVDGLGGDRPLNSPDVVVLANALRACSSLTALSLCSVGLWLDPGAAAVLLGALTGHASLRTLNLLQNWIKEADRDAAGALLGALVAANSPALTALCVSESTLCDAGLAPLFDALPANTHLTTLRCSLNRLTDAFVCDALLPAVRSNGSLRQLRCTPQEMPGFLRRAFDARLNRQLYMREHGAAEHALAEAEALVAQRAAGR
jgi:hypothetical protein